MHDIQYFCGYRGDGTGFGKLIGEGAFRVRDSFMGTLFLDFGALSWLCMGYTKIRGIQNLGKLYNSLRFIYGF